jgi:hypothetical protein
VSVRVVCILVHDGHRSGLRKLLLQKLLNVLPDRLGLDLLLVADDRPVMSSGLARPVSVSGYLLGLDLLGPGA